MKNEFNRTDGLFSLCGLNCAVIERQLRECAERSGIPLVLRKW